MPDRHISPRLLDKLLRGDASAEEIRELAWHLVEACPDCAHAVDVKWAVAPEVAEAEEAESLSAHHGAGGRRSERDDPLDSIFGRVESRIRRVAAQVGSDRRSAPEAIGELVALPPARRRLLAFNNARFQTLAVVELLLDRVWEKGPDDPAEALKLADLAIEILDRVDESSVGRPLVDDVRARGWALRGNLLRIGSDYRGAEEAFRRARVLLSEGSGDLLERARLLTLESTLRRVQARSDDAASLLNEAVEIYSALDERHLLGRTMVNQALLLNEQGEPAEAIVVLQQAQQLIDPEREPYLERIVQQNLVVYLSELGRYEEAMRLLPALRTRVVAQGTRTELLRLRWQEGKIHLGLGNERRAEAALLEVRRGFVELDLAYDAAAISLELAALYMRQGRTAEIRELSTQMLPIFQSRDLHQEAIAALLLFQRAVQMDTLTLRMVEEVADVVRRSQERPRPQTPEPS